MTHDNVICRAPGLVLRNLNFLNSLLNFMIEKYHQNLILPSLEHYICDVKGDVSVITLHIILDKYFYRPNMS